MQMIQIRKKLGCILTSAALFAGIMNAMPAMPAAVFAADGKAGDCDGNGKLEAADVLLLHDALIGKADLSTLSAGADFDGNGKVNAADLSLQKAQYADDQKTKTVTVLVYQCGSDLESQDYQATEDLLEMFESAASDNLSLVVETGGSKKWYNSVSAADANYRIWFRGTEYGSKRISDKPKNMGDYQTLQDFIVESTAEFPADRYALVIWDHGGGPIYGACNDELKDDVLLVPELTYALEQANVHFDWIGFDCCLMGSAEVAYAVRQYADYMVGSEDSESGLGWAYENFLSQWALNTNMPTEKLLHYIVDDMVSSNRYMRASATLAAYDLSKAEPLMNALTTYMNDVYKLWSQDKNTILQARKQMLDYGEGMYDLVDIGSMTDNLKVANSDLVKNALNDMVIYKGNNMQEKATGATVWFFKEVPESYSNAELIYPMLGIDETYTKQICEMAKSQVQQGWWRSGVMEMPKLLQESDDTMIQCGWKVIQSLMMAKMAEESLIQ